MRERSSAVGTAVFQPSLKGLVTFFGFPGVETPGYWRSSRRDCLSHRTLQVSDQNRLQTNEVITRKGCIEILFQSSPNHLRPKGARISERLTNTARIRVLTKDLWMPAFQDMRVYLRAFGLPRAWIQR